MLRKIKKHYPGVADIYFRAILMTKINTNVASKNIIDKNSNNTNNKYRNNKEMGVNI